MSTMERKITIHPESEVYDVDGEPITFDEVTRRIERYAIELGGRNKAPSRFIDQAPDAVRGSQAAYDLMRTLEDALLAVVTDEDPAVALLSPMLIGCEGHRVHATTFDGDERIFTVVRTEDPIPTHIERTVSGDRPAENDYRHVEVIG